MDSLRYFIVPYDMGREAVGVGAGPQCVIEAASAELPRQAVVHVRAGKLAAGGPGNVAEINAMLAAAVRECREQTLPVVLAGNCNSCLGTLAGLGRGRVGVVWLDAHGDFHTAKTSRSGFLDGMALAAAVGHTQQNLAAAVGLQRNALPADVVLLGVQDLEEAEKLRLKEHGVRWLGAAQTPRRAGGLIQELGRRVGGVYLHVDMDFLDPRESPGVNYRGPGGVPVADGEKLILDIARSVPLRAVAFTNYNPDHDPRRRTAAVVVRLIKAVRKGLSD